MKNHILIAVVITLALGLGGGIYAAKKTGGFFSVRQVVDDDGVLRVSPADVPGLLLKAEGGDVMAQTLLGTMYAYGHAVPRDYEKAFYWLQKAAEQDNETAQFHLAGMYKDGHGVPRDSKKSVYWMEKAAESGHFRAPYFLAMAYEKGQGVPISWYLSKKWYRKAAEAAMEAEKVKHPEAARQLAFLYFKGNGGLPIDEQLAVEWMEKAAQRGDPVAKDVLPKFRTAAQLAETARNMHIAMASMPPEAVEAMKARLTPERTPREILELFMVRPKHEYSQRADKYDASKDANSIEFLKALTAHVKSRDPVADADRAVRDNRTDIFIPHGHSRGLYTGITTIDGPDMDTYHEPGVVCAQRRKGFRYLGYGTYALGEGYSAESDFVSAFAAYIRAYNRALVAHPDYLNPYSCQLAEDTDSK